MTALEREARAHVQQLLASVLLQLETLGMVALRVRAAGNGAGSAAVEGLMVAIAGHWIYVECRAPGRYRAARARAVAQRLRRMRENGTPCVTVTDASALIPMLHNLRPMPGSADVHAH